MTTVQQIAFGMELKDLQKFVNYTRNALGNSKTDLEVMIFRMEVKGDKLFMFAFDKEIFARAEVAINNTGGKDGPFAVLGNKMEKLITTVNSERVQMAVDSENVEITAGYLTVNFELYDEAKLRMQEGQFVTEAGSVLPGGVVVPRAALEEGLVCAKSCATSESVRPDVNHAELRGARILSSDGRKILVYSHKKMPDGVTLKVPAAALQGVIGLLKNMEGDSVVVAEGKSYYYLQNGKYLAGVRKIEREFPPVESWIVTAEEPADTISVDRVLLDGMVKGVALGLASDDVKVNLTVQGTGANASLEVATVNSVGRRSHEAATCGRKADQRITFPVSFKHLSDTLAVFKGDSVVDMYVHDKRSILMIKDRTEDRDVLTVVPFRTSEAVAKEKQEAEAAAKARAEAKTKADEAKPKDTKAAAAALAV